MRQLTLVTDIYNNVTHEVNAFCQHCMRTEERFATRNSCWIFNTTSGLLHVPGYDTNEKTACGKDCTGETWLHQE